MQLPAALVVALALLVEASALEHYHHHRHGRQQRRHLRHRDHVAALSSSSSSSHSRAAAPVGGLNFGKGSCQCIGIQGITGTTLMKVKDNTTAGQHTVEYPAEVGSYCKAWDDDTDPDCKDGKAPGKGKGWCAEAWCYVDACHCEGVSEAPRSQSSLEGVAFQGMALYYSYATCGAKDHWTASHNPTECTVAKTEEECTKIGDGSECSWGATPWGKKCLGWEAAGMCMGLPEVSPWGRADCPCVGFIGKNGTVMAQTHHGPMEYPADMGSVCQAWDMDHDPDCKGPNPAEGCDQKWCFVDPDKCNLADKPMVSDFLPDATWQGHRLHYSYVTCGSTMPPHGHHGPGTTTRGPSPAPAPEAAGAAPTPAEAAAMADTDADATAVAEEEAVPSSDVYDHTEYHNEWRDEWRQGKAPAFRDKHPWAKAFEDRQSDGKPSGVQEFGFDLKKVEEAVPPQVVEAPIEPEQKQDMGDSEVDYLDPANCPHCVGLPMQKKAKVRV